ncbi:alpha/beta hydrolase [Rhodococcus sp. T7]|uniref:alpha/beta hydrolase n=1 Tax=Rhodococcus sp. T7 TaxID=627444 RepID=UPI00135C36A2|nr:alpha/beta hydrolase [Rhodococcus sp. T7]KAF0960006.1 Acetyl esterase [Rhodococcus sp. T7]
MTTSAIGSGAPVSAPVLSFAERAQRFAFTALGRMPRGLLGRLAKVPVNNEGDRMAPEIAALMRITEMADDYSDGTAVNARILEEAQARIFAEDFPPFAIAEELSLPSGLRATRYRARATSRGLLVFFHGGGFVLGSRASYDSPARLLASGADVDVLSIEYRRAPEHPFPAATDDALTAWKFAVEHAAEWGHNPRTIIIAGDSAGANLTAVLAQQIRGQDIQPQLQVLIYPVTDLVGDHASRAEFATNPALTEKQIAWFTDQYLPAGVDRADPRISPVRAEHLSGLPPAVVVVAGFDALRDEGIAYAERLRESGVPTQLLREGGLVHGFISWTRVSPASRAAVERVIAAISESVSR